VPISARRPVCYHRASSPPLCSHTPPDGGRYPEPPEGPAIGRFAASRAPARGFDAPTLSAPTRPGIAVEGVEVGGNPLEYAQILCGAPRPRGRLGGPPAELEHPLYQRPSRSVRAHDVALAASERPRQNRAPLLCRGFCAGRGDRRRWRRMDVRRTLVCRSLLRSRARSMSTVVSWCLRQSMSHTQPASTPMSSIRSSSETNSPLALRHLRPAAVLDDWTQAT